MTSIRLSFRAKTAITLTSVGALIIFAVSWLAISQIYSNQESALLVRSQSVSELFAATARDAVNASDLATLDSITQEILALPSLVFARVLDVHGRVIASGGNVSPSNTPIHISSNIDDTVDGVYSQSVDIGMDKVRFGRVEIGISVEPIYVSLRESISRVLIYSFAGLIVIGLCAYFFSAILVRPLDRLREGAGRIADGDVGYTLPESGDDEIARTAAAFNQMSQKLLKLTNQRAREHVTMELTRAIQAEFIANPNDPAVFQRALTHIMALTNSEIGLLGCVSDNSDNRKLLQAQAPNVHVNAASIFSAYPDIQRALAATPDSPSSSAPSTETTDSADWKTLYTPLTNGDVQLGVIALAKRGLYNEDDNAPLAMLWSALTALIHAAKGEQQRSQVERDLADSAQGTRALLDNVIDGIISIDTKSIILECNPAAEKLFGYTRAELVGKNVRILMPDPTSSSHHDYLAEFTSTGVAGIIGIDREVRAIRKDGTEFPMEIGIGVVRDEQGPRAYIGIVRDIAVRKETEEALRKARDVALWTVEAKSHFLATISHELRTPMHGMLGMLDLLLNASPNEQQRKFIQTAKRSGQNLLEIINDVLDLSKLESGRVEVERRDFDLRGLVAETTAIMSKKADAKKIVYNASIAENLPERVKGDSQKLRQILTNLVGNAIKFTDQGFVSVNMSATLTTGDSITVYTEIQDSGVGITNTAAEKLFAPFQQGDNTTTRRYGGTGLGLAICKQLAEALGGEIGFTSSPGAGSRFWFTMKLGYGNPRIEENGHMPASTETVDESNSAPLYGNVLLAEDNAVNQEVALTMLRGLGLQVDLAENGRIAFELSQHKRYDVVLMDCQMPELDGFEATRLIREAERVDGKPRLAIIALTANAMQGDQEVCEACGMDKYLSKPFSAADLRAKITPYLAQQDGVAQTEVAQSPEPFREVFASLDVERLGSLKQILGARFLEVVQKFEDNTRVILQRMDDARETANNDELMRAAHSLKGSSGTIGAIALYKVSSELEDAARQGPVANAADTINTLRSEFTRFCGAVEPLKRA